MKILGFEPRVTPLLHSKCSDLLLWDPQKLIYLFFLEFPGIFVLIQFWPIIVPTIIRRKIGGARWGKFRNDKNVIFTVPINLYILSLFSISVWWLSGLRLQTLLFCWKVVGSNPAKVKSFFSFKLYCSATLNDIYPFQMILSWLNMSKNFWASYTNF